jgi:glycine cleavage system H lipoate-binding protein
MHFSKDHEWVEVQGDVATIGITAYAAEQLGDVVFVELPDAGKSIAAGEPSRSSRASRPPPTSTRRSLAR